MKIEPQQRGHGNIKIGEVLMSNDIVRLCDCRNLTRVLILAHKNMDGIRYMSIYMLHARSMDHGQEKIQKMEIEMQTNNNDIMVFHV